MPNGTPIQEWLAQRPGRTLAPKTVGWFCQGGAMKQTNVIVPWEEMTPSRLQGHEPTSGAVNVTVNERKTVYD